MTGPAIEVHDLVVRYRKTIAVNRITFEAHAGQIVALLGPNGAGKTSTVETLEGYRRPTVGTVRVLGLDPHHDHKALTKRIGVMLQKGGIYPSMSPREAVRLFAHYYDESEEPEGLLYRVGLVPVASTPWRRLSGGEQQRLSLALALIGRPWVAFLDEPTAGVDPQGRLAIREVIKDLRSAGACVLLTTHEMQEAERLADRIIIIDRGQIVADGSPAELMAKEGGKEIRFGAPAGLDILALGAALAVAVEEVQPGEYLVHGDSAPATIAALAAWLAERDLPMADLRAGRQRLEDVFLRLTTHPAPPPDATPPGTTRTPAANDQTVVAAERTEDAAAPRTDRTGEPDSHLAVAADTTGHEAAPAPSDLRTPAAGNGTTTAGPPDGTTADSIDTATGGMPGGATTAGGTPPPVPDGPDRAAALGGRRRRRVGAGGQGPGATQPSSPELPSDGDL